MAAAIYHGKTSEAHFSVDGGGTFTQFTTCRSWTVTLTAATADATGMAATTGRLNIAGIISGTASVECVYDGTTYVQLDESDNATYAAGSAGIELDLLRDATDASFGYNGGAQCTGVVVGVAIDGTPTVTYNFVWTGTVTEVVENGTP